MIDKGVEFKKIVVVAWLFFSIAANTRIGTAQITSKIDRGEDCEYRWFCSNWIPAECPENGIQTRTCTNTGDCADDYDNPSEKRGCEFEIPKQLFDIKLELEESVIYYSSELTAWVRFESFGTEPTPVELTYSILNQNGIEVYRDHDSVIVETERFAVKKFGGLGLDSGKYTLFLKTIYDVDVEDEFRQEFEIKNKMSVLTYFLIGFVVLIVKFLRKGGKSGRR